MKMWIARDSYGLWLFENKPKKVIINGDKCCKTTIGNRYKLDDELFPKITFENSPNILECRLQFTGDVPSELVPEIKLAPPQNNCIDFIMFPYIGQALIGDDMKTLAESLPETDKETDFCALIEDII